MPISEERKKQLSGLIEKIKANPELLKQFQGATQPTQPTQQPKVREIQQRIGLGIGPVSAATGGKLVSAAISETAAPAPPETLEAIQARITATKTAEQAITLGTGQRISFTNLEKVAGSISGLDRLFAEGHREGQIGAGLASETLLKTAKTVGGGFQDERAGISSAFEGKKPEVLFNMIPMLTQQGDKAGSVRIISSVLRLLGLTLPGVGTGLKTGRRMMSESVRSFFRFARAAELGGLEFDKEFGEQELDAIGDKDLEAWIAKVKRGAGRVQLSDDEAEALEDFIGSALEASDKLIEERKGMGEPSPEEATVAAQKGAVGFDTERGVFVDAQGNEVQ